MFASMQRENKFASDKDVKIWMFSFLLASPPGSDPHHQVP